MKNDKRFLITIEEEKHQVLADLAWENRQSLTEYIRILLTKHIEEVKTDGQEKD